MIWILASHSNLRDVALCVKSGVPVKLISKTVPASTVPKEVIVVLPVIMSTLPVAFARLTVEAATISAAGACLWSQYFLFHIV